jgi:hypothetical protein
MAAFAAGALIFLHSSTALAQISRYSSDWRNPNTQAQPGDSQVQGLADELNKMIDSATTSTGSRL